MSCDQPQTGADVDSHEYDKCNADAARHFPPALGNVRFLGQQNLARIAVHAGMDSSRDRELALQLFVRSQLLFQRGTLYRGELTIKIIEELVGIHVLREA